MGCYAWARDLFDAALKANGIPYKLRPERLEAMLALFLEQVHTLGAGEQRISCSAGAVPLRPGQTAEALYQAADRMLYRAKQQGRGRYVLDAAREPAASEGEPV